MALEDLRDSLKESLQRALSSLQESSAYIEVAEKYQALSPVAQKGVAAGAGALGLLIALFIPGLYYSSASTTLEDYESKRLLIRELYHVSHQAAGLGGSFASVGASTLQSLAQNVVNGASLQPEQILSVTAVPDVNVPGIPKSIEHAGVNVALGKLNLTQVIDIGYKLQTLDARSRMVGVEVKANPTDGHYFDVTYRIVAFSPKPEAAAANTKGAAKRPGGRG